MACSVWMCLNVYGCVWIHTKNHVIPPDTTCKIFADCKARHTPDQLSYRRSGCFRKSGSPPSCTSCVEAEAVHPDALRGNSSRWCGKWLAWTPPWTRPRHGGLKKHGHKRLKQPVSSGFTSSEIWWGKSEKKTSLEFVDVNDFMIGIILTHRIPMWLLAPLGVCDVPSTSFFHAQLIGQKSYNLSRNEMFIRFLVRLPVLTLSVSQTYEKSRCFKRKVFQLSLCFQCLQQAKKWCGFSNPTELNTESLDFNENFSDIDDLTFDQRLQEDAHQAYQAILHVLVLNVFTRGNAVGDVKMNKLMGQVDRCS